MTRMKAIFVGIVTLASVGLIRCAIPTSVSAPVAVKLPIRTMEFGDAARVDQMAKLLDRTRTVPAQAYTKLPDETTLTESRLIQILAYLQSVRPTDGDDGPTGAKRMGALIKDAANQYRGYLSRRLASVNIHP